MKFARNHAKSSLFSKKLSNSVAVVFMFATIAIMCGIVLVSHLMHSSKTNDSISKVSNTIGGFVSGFLDEKIAMISESASSEEICEFLLEQNLENSSKIDGILDSFCASEGVINAFVMSQENDFFYSDKNHTLINDKYNPTGWKNDFYVTQNMNTLVVSSLETSNFIPEKEVVTIVSSVYSNDLLLGYLGMEIDLDSLFTVLELYSANSSSYPIISTFSGSSVYAPESKSYGDFSSVHSDDISSAIHNPAHIKMGIEVYSTEKLRQNKYHIDSVLIPNWTIIVFFDMDNLGFDISDLMLFEMAISFVCIAVLFLVIIRKLTSQMRDLDSITEKSQRIANLDFSEKTSLGDKSAFYILDENLSSISTILAEKKDIIAKQESIDLLTELPNRFSLYKALKERIAAVSSPCTEKFAVLVIDIDNFKWLNENMGHKFGDEILCKFAKIISGTFSEENLCFRFNGDEFVVIVPFGDNYSIIGETVKKIRKQFSSTIKILNDHIYIRFSIGISIFPDNESNADVLIRNAEIALRKAKESGKEQEAYYSNIVEKQSYNNAAIAKSISTALENEEFYINYQPILVAETSDIYGFEALLRWNSRSFGNISPTEFIGVAETTGDIIQIGSWIFESSCRFLKKLCDSYRDDIIMSINVSAVQLNRPDYIEHVKRVIEITQVNPKNIQIEITESAIVDFNDGNTAINELNKLGITLALDDFGTGYSSLSYLKKFPIKCLKIDKSFIDEINKNDRDFTISNSIIELVHGLNIKTIAEGIETFDQYNFLKDMNCDYIQGFLMSKPLNEDTALDFVRMYDELHKPTIDVLKEKGYLLEKEKSDLAFAEK